MLEPNKDYYVKNLREYKNAISAIHDAIPNASGRQTCYRGENGCHYESKPTIFRPDARGLDHKEAELYEAGIACIQHHQNQSTSMPAEFETLAFLQHYGVKTRLLDFTRCPYIALYFACQATASSCPRENARVLIFNIEMKKSDDQIVRDIVQEAFTSFKMRSHASPNLKTVLFVDGIINSSTSTHAQQYNERCDRQQGVFLLVGLENESFSLSPKSGRGKEYEGHFKQITILGEGKKKILSELRQMGIDEASLFPELEYQLKELNSSILSQGKKQRTSKTLDQFCKTCPIRTKSCLSSIHCVELP